MKGRALSTGCPGLYLRGKGFPCSSRDRSYLCGALSRLPIKSTYAPAAAVAAARCLRSASVLPPVPRASRSRFHLPGKAAGAALRSRLKRAPGESWNRDRRPVYEFLDVAAPNKKNTALAISRETDRPAGGRRRSRFRISRAIPFIVLFSIHQWWPCGVLRTELRGKHS